MKHTKLTGLIILFLFNVGTLIAQPPPPPMEASFLCNEYETIISPETSVSEDGYWLYSGGVVFDDPTSVITNVSNLAEGKNNFAWFSNEYGIVQLIYIIYVNNGYADAGEDKEICTSYTNIYGSFLPEGETGIWSVISGSGTFEDESANYTIVNNLSLGENLLRWTVTNGECSDSDTIMITNNSFDAYAGLDQILEPLSTDTYFEAELPENCIGQWSIVSGSANILDDSSPTSYVYNMPKGTHTFSWTVYNTLLGCYNSDDVMITVIGMNPPILDIIVCADTVKLNAKIEPGATSHTWSVVSGTGVFDDIHDSETVVRNVSLGENIYRWTISFTGYLHEEDHTVYNDSIFLSAGDDVETCNRFHQMNAQQLINANISLWTPLGLGGGTIVNNTAWNTLVTDLAPGSSYFEWYVSNGNCESRDTVILHYNLPPIAQFETDPSEFCAPETVTVQNTSTHYGGLSPPDVFEWVIENNSLDDTYDIDGSFEYLLTNTGNEDSIYHIRLVAIDSETMCTDTFYNNVIALAAPVVEFQIIPDEPLRIPNAVFTIQNQSDANIISYLWDFGNSDNRYDTEFISSFDYEYFVEGTYEISLFGTSSSQCYAMHTETVVVLPYTSVDEINSNFKVFPNPTDALITITSTTDLSDAVLELKNIAGQEVQYKLIEQTSQSYGIDLSNLAKGMYFLKINLKGETKMLRLVKN